MWSAGCSGRWLLLTSVGRERLNDVVSAKHVVFFVMILAFKMVMKITSREGFTYVSSHRSPIQTPQRSRRGQMLNKLQSWTRKKERERSCESVWCLEIMCIFSHESIEKSLPHNLQEPNSRGDVNAEDGEVIVDSKSFSTQNAQVGYWLIGAQI